MATGSLHIAMIVTLLANAALACGGSPAKTEGTSPSVSADVQTPKSNASVPAPQTKAQTTVTINGKPRTCAELICENPKGCDAAAQCNENYQGAFDRWGSRIDAYVTSGTLGPLGNRIGTIDAPHPGSRWRYQDVAAAGLTACFIADRGGNADRFIDFMLKSHPKEERVAFLPLWFDAERHLCPGVEFRKDRDDYPIR